MEEIKRKLASIRLISDIKPIDGADNIELAIVDGWQCVVKKGDFKAGQLCVYFEIDSFLPIRPEFEFLRKSSYKKMGDKEGFRLRTIKLRGQISQGLALKPDDIDTNIIPDIIRIWGIDVLEGEDGWWDLTEELGVIKYEPPIPACLQGKVRGNFPSFIRKTDLERVQNIWDKVKDDEQLYEVTLKLDGTSATYYMKDGKFGVCSRNLDLEEDENNVYWKMARKYDIEHILRALDRNLAFQGEIIGEGIQGNPEGIFGQEFYLFDVWDIDNQRYLSPRERISMLELPIGENIKHCPIMGRFPGWDDSRFRDLKEFNKDISKILDFSNGKSMNASIREGLVYKGIEIDTRFKVISNEYLLKDK